MGDLEILNNALDNNDTTLIAKLSQSGSQSFFRDIGDCEDINLATKDYFQLYSPGQNVSIFPINFSSNGFIKGAANNFTQINSLDC